MKTYDNKDFNMAGALYTDKHLEQLDKNNDILVDIIKTTHGKYTRSSDNRDARLLIEAVNSSNESIHKQAANIAKMEAIKSNDETKDIVASLLFQLATSTSNLKIQDHNKMLENTNIILPVDMVEGELFIGSGSLELDDIKEKE